MTEYLFENNPTGTLETAIGTSDITLDLESGEGDGFPSPSSGQAFHVYVEEGSDYEWMVCTARSGDNLTVTRSGSPQTFSAGATAELCLHADALTNMHQKGTERTVTSDPDGSLTAAYSGEEVYNSVTGIWHKHCEGTTWKAMNA